MRLGSGLVGAQCFAFARANCRALSVLGLDATSAAMLSGFDEKRHGDPMLNGTNV